MESVLVLTLRAGIPVHYEGTIVACLQPFLVLRQKEGDLILLNTQFIYSIESM